ncbi:hypothetical protein M3Y97_00773700 [Aphelenchoides bicaudatus]|nr:hypothetical protein M3Y97_00773700 [Aphelenchoides bicaudatus]
MKSLIVVFVLLTVFCVQSAHTRKKRQTYLCGFYPYQYYSNTPCNQNGNQQPRQPGSRCQNGGTYIGWTCQQSIQCQFSTPSGILNGQCSNGLCCTAGSSRSTSNRQCPANMVRRNRACSLDSHCILNSSRGQQLYGRCSNGQCCLPKLTRSRNQGGCKSNERRTGRQCSRSNPCQRNSYWVIASCRNNVCCERDTNQAPLGNGNQPQQQNPCSAYGRTWANQQCSWNGGGCYSGTCINGYCCL